MITVQALNELKECKHRAARVNASPDSRREFVDRLAIYAADLIDAADAAIVREGSEVNQGVRVEFRIALPSIPRGRGYWMARLVGGEDAGAERELFGSGYTKQEALDCLRRQVRVVGEDAGGKAREVLAGARV